MGRFFGRAESGAGGRWRLGLASTRLHAEAVSVCRGDRGKTTHGGIADRGFSGLHTHRQRPLYSAELRPAFQGLGLGAHGTGRVAQRARGAHPGDGGHRQFSRTTARVGLAAARVRRLLRLQPRAGQCRGAAAVPHQRLSHAGQRRPLDGCGAAVGIRQGAECQDRQALPPGDRRGRGIHRGRHALRHQCPRAHVWHGQRAQHPLLVGGQDGHQQGHARQLGARLVAALHGGRVGGQCQRRTDARRERHQRRCADLGRADALAAPQSGQQGTSGTRERGQDRRALWRARHRRQLARKPAR